jgi:hypothetical protein
VSALAACHVDAFEEEEVSYHEKAVLGRALIASEAREAAGIIKRLTAVVLMQPQLDANSSLELGGRR